MDKAAEQFFICCRKYSCRSVRNSRNQNSITVITIEDKNIPFSSARRNSERACLISKNFLSELCSLSYSKSISRTSATKKDVCFSTEVVPCTH